jgi:hypothetical protein
MTLRLLAMLTLALAPMAAQKFKPGCALPAPLSEIKEVQQVDKACGIEGIAAEAPHKRQNRAKNNFCATGDVVDLDHQTFLDLFEKVKETGNIPFGSSNSLPADRSVLKDILTVNGKRIGEGTMARYAGFMLDARHSNKSKGESVNCQKGGEAFNDIHIDLVKSVDDDDPCDSISAEISPHLRPESWDDLEHLHLHDRPVRVTGPLFFDASHVPCGAKRSSPARASIWEIHPVYNLEICKRKSMSACKADDSLWVPLHEWDAH